MNKNKNAQSGKWNDNSKQFDRKKSGRADKSGTNKSRANKRRGNDNDDRQSKQFSKNGARGSDSPLSSLNDLSWYARNPRLLQAAGSFPFPWRPGMAMPAINMASGGKSYDGYFDIPGVMALTWIPSIGESSTSTDPASIAAKEIFGKVREKFSGSIEADAPDFIIYLMALDSIFSAIGSLKRIYRIVGSYAPENFIIPEILLRAIGLSDAGIENWRSNKMQAYQYINELIAMTGKFMCPAVMDLFNRHYWMNDNVYTDAATINSQMYVFTQEWYYKYDLVDTPEGQPAGGLTAAAVDLTSPTTAYNSVRTLIEALAGSDDAYIISGYLMRAFEGSPIFSVAPIELNERFTPAYVPEVLTQIENSRVVPWGLKATCSPISQDPKANALIHQPQCTPKTFTQSGISMPEAAMTLDFRTTNFLSIRSDAPTVADSVIASRLTCYVHDIEETSDNVFTAKIVCGTEIPAKWTLWRYQTTDGPDGPERIILSEDVYGAYIVDNRSGDASQLVTYAGGIPVYGVSHYDWAPFMEVITLAGAVGGQITPTVQFLGDIHNFTMISNADLKNLHRICVYSEFNAFSLNP
uniref:Capsid protein n=1 Tax=Shelduck picobirnavirus II TaxID=2212780 RepID=A0A3G1RPI0_9VIRU|nr:MAG: capsid protein [Shelduck picobirnavirus II]